MLPTTKKFVPAVNRFEIGDEEAALAEAWRKSELAEGLCAERFYEGVIQAHGVQLSWLRKPEIGVRRSNEAQAAFDFVRHLFAVYKVGLVCASQVFDRNVSGNEVLLPEGRKPQAKRALQQSVLGSKEWGVFLNRLEKIANGFVLEKFSSVNRKTDRDFVLHHANAIVNRMSRDAEKHDGSIPFSDTAQIARAIADVLSSFNIKL